MAKTPVDVTELPCVNCIDKLEAWVSHNNGADWFEIPNVTRIQKQASRSNATQIKLQGVSQNVCSASSKSFLYLVDLWVCKDLHYRNYMQDGDVIWIRLVDGDAFDTDQEEIVKATYDDDGYTKDDQSTTPDKVTLRLDASIILTKNFVRPGGGVPAETATGLNSPAADITAAGVTL